MKHLTMQELEEGLPHIQESPKDEGKLEMIVRRPAENEREIIEEGELHTEDGLVGDNWKTRGSSRTDDGSAHPLMQLNIMNARSIDLIAQSKDRWHLAGDQLFVDLDLSNENLKTGDQLTIGSAIVEVTEIPHNGCKKFTERYGIDSMKFVNSAVGKQLHLRGINAKVIQNGTIRAGDVVKKISI